MNNILVTGANGQLGSEIKAVKRKGNYFFTGTKELDVTDKKAVQNFVELNNIDIIINCAGYTNVDKAEDEQESAKNVNYQGVRNLAKISNDKRIYLIHISTDYVFDGTKNTPYNENDVTNPLGGYGRSKLKGEQAIQDICKNFLILRTSWLYSVFGHNFVKTIDKFSAEKEQLKVVFDQVGTPTNAQDLAEFIVYFIEKEYFKNNTGIYHFSNEGVCSWYDFAKEIVLLSNNICSVLPCYSSEYKTKVTRPNYSVLDKAKLRTDFSYDVPYWRDSLKKMYKKYKEQK